mmetsp:Transcript_29362/g.66939  ORF Transcript_29362/g.66939 Transcript_29362/m.66939 type:complete len:938 (+) Transcript_29362:140-2953(+)
MSSTTWRSPISILMGAAQNDDEDLRLRNDNFNPSTRRLDEGDLPNPAGGSAGGQSVSVPPITPEPASPLRMTTPKSGTITSYVPFRLFGLTSPAAPYESNGFGRAKQNSRGLQNAGPPSLAFPPPVIDELATNEMVETDTRDDLIEGVVSNVNANTNCTSHDRQDESYRNNNSGRDDGAPSSFGQRRRGSAVRWEDRKSIIDTTFNFTNSIIGAGAMRLGGAFAASGGGISIICLIGFAVLTKQSLDMIVDMSSCPDIIRKAREGRKDSSESSGEFGRSSEESEDSGEDDGEGEDEELLQQLMNGGNDETADYGANDFLQPSKADTQQITDPCKRAESEQGNGATPECSDMYDSRASQGDPMKDLNMLTSNEGEGQRQSPLMAREDLPLIPPEGHDEIERYDSLTASQPKLFSPLGLETKDETTRQISIQFDNPALQFQATMSPLTYEELGRAAYGTSGRMAVLLSKALYSFGCLVAYIIVIRDNFGPALRNLAVDASPTNVGDEKGWIYDDDFLAFWISALVVLPLSAPRSMEPLAKFSFISILAIVFLILVVVYLYFTCTNPAGGASDSETFFDNWIAIRSFSGFMESLGTFVFTFVCHHCVNLAYESLPIRIRNPTVWRRVSTNSMTMATEASLAIGIFAYLTFGARTPADVLLGYPSTISSANAARLLLCVTMALTFPLPFLTVRESLVLVMTDLHHCYYYYRLERINIAIPLISCLTYLPKKIIRIVKEKRRRSGLDLPTDNEGADDGESLEMRRKSIFDRVRRRMSSRMWSNYGGEGDLEDALLQEDENTITLIGGEKGKPIDVSPMSSTSGDPSSDEETINSRVVPQPTWLLSEADGRQLKFAWHFSVTFSIWLAVTVLAIKSPSLGDVLNLVGSFSGTLIAFVLPSVFSFKLRGYSLMAWIVLVVGGVIGFLGSTFALAKFFRDIHIHT